MALKLGVLDHASIDEGVSAATAVAELDQLVELAESLDYEHFWLSEHHGQDFTASTAPEILLARLASRTNRIKLGSGGIMLSNYSAYKVAEVFNTLETLAPGRMQLGLGRATGADLPVTAALNDEKQRQLPFDRKLPDLLGFLGVESRQSEDHRGLLARPLPGSRPTPWVLTTGSATADLAGELGVGLNFAHFINPSGKGVEAAARYRETFRPSPFLDAPSVLVTVSVAVADTEGEAQQLADAVLRWLAEAEQQLNQPTLPRRDGAAPTRPQDLSGRVLAGTGEQVYRQLEQIAADHGTDQVMVNPNVPGAQHRLRALELLAAARDRRGG